MHPQGVSVTISHLRASWKKAASCQNISLIRSNFSARHGGIMTQSHVGFLLVKIREFVALGLVRFLEIAQMVFTAIT